VALCGIIPEFRTPDFCAVQHEMAAFWRLSDKYELAPAMSAMAGANGDASNANHLMNVWSIRYPNFGS
jgi:hypothetical protein